MTDRDVLRPLARDYLAITQSERNEQAMNLHQAVNDLKPVRPVVLIDELPWNEMAIGDELTLVCSDPYLREIEWFLRSTLYKSRHLPGDMVVAPYLPVDKIVRSTGNGLTVSETTLQSDARHQIVAHEYHDILSREEDLLAIRTPVLSYDETETLRRFHLVGDLLGDIVPIRLRGVPHFWTLTWDSISAYRGVSALLLDLVDRPEFMHRTVRLLTDTSKATLAQMEQLGLFETDLRSHTLHCTPILTSDLPGKEYGGGPYTRKNIWGRGAAQIFAQVSSAMHEEFDIDYMIETIGECGLSYYGCCEPLDKKLDIVEKLPNLRKVSITPWANVDAAAERIGKRYVLSSKPNPASVAAETLNAGELRAELGRIVRAAERNGCACDIVLKDISTCGNRPHVIFEWERIAMETVRNA